MSSSVLPHGGELIDRTDPEGQAGGSRSHTAGLAAQAGSWCGSRDCPALARARWRRRCAAGLSGGRPVEILDGDEVRTQSVEGLGFSKEDRDANIRRIGFVARLLARNGVPAITAAISPYAAVRQEVRRLPRKKAWRSSRSTSRRRSRCSSNAT